MSRFAPGQRVGQGADTVRTVSYLEDRLSGCLSWANQDLPGGCPGVRPPTLPRLVPRLQGGYHPASIHPRRSTIRPARRGKRDGIRPVDRDPTRPISRPKHPGIGTARGVLGAARPQVTAAQSAAQQLLRASVEQCLSSWLSSADLRSSTPEQCLSSSLSTRSARVSPTFPDGSSTRGVSRRGGRRAGHLPTQGGALRLTYLSQPRRETTAVGRLSWTFPGSRGRYGRCARPVS